MKLHRLRRLISWLYLLPLLLGAASAQAGPVLIATARPGAGTSMRGGFGGHSFIAPRPGVSSWRQSASLPRVAQAESTPNTPGRKLRLFLIGNSFSQNASRYLPQLAREGGFELVIGRAEAPGCPLQKHWEALEAAEANPDDPKGQLYNGKTLRQLISAGTWDIVTIQQASILSGSVDSYRPYAQKLRDWVKTLQPQAEVVMHQTWAYRSDAKSFTQIAPKRTATSAREMWEQSRAAYHTIATELGVRLIPVGDAFWAVNSDPQWGYQKDMLFDFANPIYPALPNQTHSLHSGYSWQTDKDGNRKWSFDANHANDAGCYLGGLVWYGFLFGASPAALKFAPPSVAADFAAHLRQVAAQVVQTQAAKTQVAQMSGLKTG